MSDKNRKACPWKSMQIELAILAGLFICAYGFEITNVDLEDLRSERRQESLTRVMRALARPECVAYDQEQPVINAPVQVTAPAAGVPTALQADKSSAHLVHTPTSRAPGQTVLVEGFTSAPHPSPPS